MGKPRAAGLDRCPCCLRTWEDGPERQLAEALIVLDEDGSLRLVGPLATMPAPNRLRLIRVVLEARALQGDTNAARLVLEENRWRTEMRKGKAPARLDVAVTGRVTVVDDLGRMLPSPASGNGAYVNRPALPPLTIEAERVEQ